MSGLEGLRRQSMPEARTTIVIGIGTVSIYRRDGRPRIAFGTIGTISKDTWNKMVKDK